VDAFSYLSVLLSVILGLAITQILQGYRALLLSPAPVRGSMLSLAWSVLLILFVVQAWWASFGLRDRAVWTFLEFAVVLLQMVLIYMMAAVVLPDPGGDDVIELDVHFDRNRRWFFGFFLATIFTSLLKDFVLEGHLPQNANVAFHAVLAASAVGGMIARARWMQIAIVGAIALGFGFYIVLLFARL
jgi:hypothetical protein